MKKVCLCILLTFAQKDDAGGEEVMMKQEGKESI